MKRTALKRKVPLNALKRSERPSRKKSWHTIRLDQADTLFSKYIRLRDKRCQRCLRAGTGPLGIHGLDASHFQGRRKEGTRYHENNVCALCRNCHRYLGENPAEHYMFQVKRLGQALVDRIVILSNTRCKKDRKGQAFYWKERLKLDFPKCSVRGK